MKKTVGILLVMFLLTFTVFAAYYDVGVSLTYDSFSFVEKVKVEDASISMNGLKLGFGVIYSF